MKKLEELTKGEKKPLVFNSENETQAQKVGKIR